MAVGREIRDQITSISSTRKITRAMEMVAASKMRRAQERMSRGRPYAEHLWDVIGHIAGGGLEFNHPYMEQREPRSVAYLVVSTERGLCGGLNINLFKAAVADMQTWSERGVEVRLALIGARGSSFFNSIGGDVMASVSGLSEQPQVAELVGAVKVVLDEFAAGRLDRLFLVSNNFVNTVQQQPRIRQLLPLEAGEDFPERRAARWDYLYEPDDASALLVSLLTRHVESQLYQAVVENGACEQAARMVAMKSATENAGELIDDLQLSYNKARQAAITQELAEIIGGAAAV